MSTGVKTKQVAPFEKLQLLQSLTVQQLREVALAGGILESSVNGAKTKKALEALLQDSQDARIWTAAHRTEALTPFKHCYLLSWKLAMQLSAVREAAAVFMAQTPEAFKSFLPLTEIDGEFQLQTGFIDELRNRIILKFVHTVDFADWVEVDEDTLHKKRFKKRHPFVLSLRFEDNLATLAFPGYTQGSAVRKDRRISYEQACTSVLKTIVATYAGLSLESVVLKQPLEYLLRAYPKEITSPGRHIQNAGNGISVSAGGETDVISAFIALFPSLSPEDVKRALEKSGSPGMVIGWRLLDIVTRIGLKPDTTDILFIWKRGGASSVSVDQVIAFISEGVRVAGKPDLAKAIEAVSGLDIGEIVQLSTLSQQYSLQTTDASRMLLDAVRQGLLQLRFRVLTDKELENYSNVWHKRLEDLPERVIDEDGETIDLAEPRNIDVAYERTVKP